MKRVIILIGLFSMVICQTFAQTIPAFPGAEGFGKYTTGGRGGQVLIVTNLNDSGPGSLRAAIDASGPRIIVFEVSGTIELQSSLRIRNGNLTIAGQTAPGDGITIKNYPISILNSENIIIRNIRSRMGDLMGIEGDAIEIRLTKNIIIDHCSFSWGTDETMSIYDIDNATIQNSIISEGLNLSVHSKGEHGYGSLTGGNGLSIYKNIFTSFRQRMPRFTPLGKRGIIDFRNNVIFNWSARAAEGGEESTVNVIGNYFKPGPATLNTGGHTAINFLFPLGDGALGTYGKFYLEGNILEGRSQILDNQWSGVRLQNNTFQSLYLETLKNKDSNGNLIPFPVNSDFYSITRDAKSIFEKVLDAAGASFKRDAVDERIIQEIISGKTTYKGSKTGFSGIIDSQNDVGGWPVLQSLPAPLDTDRDGMPDEWEIAHGLDPNKVDHNGYDLDPYYTNIEVYINSIVSEDAMDLRLPGRPIVIAPAIDEVLIANEVSFEWNLLNESKSYHLQIAADSSFTQMVKEIKDIQAASITITDLSPEQTYFWRIRAGSDQQHTAWSEIRSFTLLAPFTNPNIEGLVGYWKMDEGQGSTLIDVSGNNNHSVILNTNDIIWENGMIDLGLKLPGNINRFASTSHNASLRFEQTLTIAAWVKPTRFGRNTIIHKNYEGKGFELSLENDGTIAFRTNRNGTPSNRLTSNFNYEPFLNQWIHVAATFNGTSSRIYINGQLDSQANFSERDITSLGGVLVIGALGTIQRFTGTLDELRLYDRTLTAEEVLELYLLPESLQKPTTPAPISPENNTKDLTNEVAFSWESISNADFYTLQISSEPNFDSDIQEFTEIATNSYTFDQLNFGQLYFWRVQAVNSNGSSEFSEVFSFETLHAPASPTLLLPESAGDNLVNPLTFSWEASEDSDSYHLQIATDVNFNQLFIDKETISVGTFTVNGLSDGSTYFWRVRASNAAGFGPYSEVRSFQTAVPVVAPIKPSLIAPTHEAAGLENPVELSWERIPNATSYHVQLAIDSEFVNLISDQQQVSSEQLQISGLAEGTSYFWRVRAENEAGFSPYSDVRNFSTKNSEEREDDSEDDEEDQEDESSEENDEGGERDEDKGEREDDSKDDEEDKNEGESNEKEGNEDGSSEEKEDEVEKGTTEEETNEAEENNTEEGSSEEENTTEEGTTEGENNTEEGSSEEGSTEEENNTEEGSSEEGSTEEENNTEEGSSEEGSTEEGSTEEENNTEEGSSEEGSTEEENNTEEGSSEEGSTEEENNTEEGSSEEGSTEEENNTEEGSSEEGSTEEESNTEEGSSEEGSTEEENNTEEGSSEEVTEENKDEEGEKDEEKGEREDDGSKNDEDGQEDNSSQENNEESEKGEKDVDNGNTTEQDSTSNQNPTAVPLRAILVSPAHQAANLAIPVVLTWERTAEATRYQVQIATDESFDQLVFEQHNVPTETLSISSLSFGTTYFWRVRAANALGFGPYAVSRTFTTGSPVTVPARTILGAPANNATELEIPVTLSWNPLEEANHYHVQVATDENFQQLILDDRNVNALEISLSNLNKGLSYFWRVRGGNTAGFGSFSERRRFSTETPTVAPSRTNLISPINNAIAVPSPVVFTWERTPAASTYQIQVSTNSTFTNLVVNESGIIENQISINTLQEETTYFWRVRATNATGSGAFSPIRSFQTATKILVPTQVQLVSPANQAEGLEIPVQLRWEKIAQTTQYQLQVASDANFNQLVLNETGLSGEQFTLQSLETGTSYFWRVRASNSAGTGDYSTVRSFSTKELLQVPEATQLLSPANQASNVQVPVLLTWEKTATAEFYHIQVAKDQQFQNIVLEDKNRVTESIQVSNLEAGTTYFWRVRAGNAAGIGAFSSIRSFTTQRPRPDAPILVSPGLAQVVSHQNIHFTWNSVENANSYQLQVSMNANFTQSVILTPTNLQTTSFTLESLEADEVYFWRVRAFNEAGPGAYSQGSSFITSAIPALETPVLVSPRNNSQWDIRNILLKWNAVEGAVNYCIQLSTDPSFERNVETVCAIQGTEYQVQNLKQNQVYYWRVQAMGTSASAYSESWKFEITNKISENQPAQVKVTSYPNPFTDQINLMFTPGFDEALFVTVYTNKGVVLFEKTYESSMDIISISLPSNLPKGMYRVRIQSKSFSDNIGMIKK